ncbi:immunoglobulin-like domain-containing protein [uncultured Bacteroides sp.]|uniref:immunoglobulin-like domain-containing protein n=1 Tax=uncultured Bacteroides sp. TaxID=162156 RepID=UPI0026050B6A|nr:immunoglobulin-like domain-containing protein [uncultured Bacteroides sp.]
MKNCNLFFLFIITLITFLSIGCKDNKYQEATEYQGTTGDATILISDSIGQEVRMETIQGNYYSSTKEVYAIVFNPQKRQLSFGRDWELEYMKDSVWIKARNKKPVLKFDDEFLPINIPEYMVFSFPIHIYEITSGRYRIKKTFYDNFGNGNYKEIELCSEFYLK